MDIAKTFTLYKLSDTAFTLSDSRASRTLDAFGKTAYSATNKETVWVLEEYDRRHGKPKIIFDTALRYYGASEVKVLNIRPLESLHTTDKRKISSTIRLRDVWAVRETYWDNVLFNMRCLESLKVREIKRNGTTLGTKKESFTMKDNEKKQFTKKQRYSLRIGDKNFKRLTISKHELTKLTEAYGRTKIYWDNVLFLLHISEDIRTTEAVRKTAVKQLDDAFCFIDSLRKASQLNKGEDLAVIENKRQAIEHGLYDGLHIMDEWRSGMQKLACEQVKALDHIAKHAVSAQFDGFHVQESYKKIWQTLQVFREELKTLDKVYRNIYAVRDDRIAIADKRLVKLERTLHESMDTDESFNRNVAFVRGLAELARIGDGLTRDIGKNPAEDIALYDAYVRASNSYIESVQVVSSFKEIDDFAAMADTPPMYEQFTDFNVGDYEYEKALLRLRVVSKATQAQPLLYDISPHVDIDDTDDKGQLEIKDTTAATKVYYNKHYYNAPEVNAMVKGGTGATTPVPNILTTDGQDDKGRYFEIELLNSSGNRTTGIVSWVAKGW